MTVSKEKEKWGWGCAEVHGFPFSTRHLLSLCTYLSREFPSQVASLAPWPLALPVLPGYLHPSSATFRSEHSCGGGLHRSLHVVLAHVLRLTEGLR